MKKKLGFVLEKIREEAKTQVEFTIFHLHAMNFTTFYFFSPMCFVI